MIWVIFLLVSQYIKRAFGALSIDEEYFTNLNSESPNSIDEADAQLLDLSECLKSYKTLETISTDRDLAGATSLHLSAIIRLKELSKETISDSEKDSIDLMGNTLLHYAAIVNNIDAIKLLISSRNVNIQNNLGELPLHHAAKIGNGNSVSLLISKKNMDVKDLSGGTPLHYAAYSGNIEAIKLLATRRNRNFRNYFGMTPLHLAVKCDMVDAVPLLITDRNRTMSDYSDMTPLHYAVKANNIVSVRLLADDINRSMKSYEKRTPLHDAICTGRFGMIDFLVTGAGKYLKDRLGRTPIYCAINSGDLSVLSKVATPRNIHGTDSFGLTPLAYALLRKKFDCVAFLIILGANTDGVDLEELNEINRMDHVALLCLERSEIKYPLFYTYRLLKNVSKDNTSLVVMLIKSQGKVIKEMFTVFESTFNDNYLLFSSLIETLDVEMLFYVIENMKLAKLSSKLVYYYSIEFYFKEDANLKVAILYALFNFKPYIYMSIIRDLGLSQLKLLRFRQVGLNTDAKEKLETLPLQR